MAAATYTEFSLADAVTITSSRFRVNPTTLDWTVTLQCTVIDLAGDSLKSVTVDVSTLISSTALNNFKAALNAGVAQLATNRGITSNT